LGVLYCRAGASPHHLSVLQLSPASAFCNSPGLELKTGEGPLQSSKWGWYIHPYQIYVTGTNKYGYQHLGRGQYMAM